MSKYDVIVAGSGFGGLCCGVILAREGLNVCVVEKEPFAGGCLRSFRRGEHLYDTGMHYVGCMDEGQILRHFLQYAGAYDRLNLRRMDDDGYDRVILGDREYRFAQGYDRFCEGLRERFPDCGTEIRHYADAVHRVGEEIGVDKLREGILSAGGLDSLSLSASSEINRLITDPQLRKVVAATNFLYDGIRDRSLFHTHAMIQHSFINEAVRFVDGTQQLADALVGEIRRNGGEVRCRAEVEKILHRDNRVVGVRLTSGEELSSDRIISDLHPATMLELVGEGSKIRPSYVRRINSLENSFGVFTVWVRVDKKRFPYRNCNYYIADPREVWSDPQREHLPHTLMVSMQPLSEGDDEIVTLLSPCPSGMFARWADTRIGNRGEEYLELKEKMTEQLLDEADGCLGGLKSAVREVFAASPLTYRDYTGVKEGSAYGIMNDCLRPLESLLNPVCKLGGLYLTGQNVNNHGALGVLMTSIATCGELLGREYVCRKIGNF